MDLTSNTKLTTALDDASGEIDAALRTGGRYTTDDLEGLTGNSLSHLKRICSDLAMSNLFYRRPGVRTELAAHYHDKGKDWVEQLRTGVNLFDLAANVTASNPTINGPSAIDYQRINLLSDRMNNFFPGRAGRLPTDRV